MIFLSIILANLLFTSANLVLENDQCDAATKTCPDAAENTNDIKLLLYDVNPPEGFNLRRDVYMRFAIMLAEAQKDGKKENWRLVLPPWYNLFHWKSRVVKHEPMSWSYFFQVDALKSYAPVLEFNETFSQFTGNAIEIDVLYVLQNYKKLFEDGDYDDKWETTEDCYYDGEFWGYNNVTVKETVCVHYQGKISMLWELVALHPSAKTIMFSNGEIPLHTSYGTKVYWDCRKSMKFSKRLLDIADEYIKKELSCNKVKCDSYMAVHWRRQDFARSRGKDVPSPEQTAAQINKLLYEKRMDITGVFLATDATAEEIKKLKAALSRHSHEVKMFSPNHKDAMQLREGDYAVIDQIICSRAVYFIGTHESTFSFRIQEEREILGFPKETTFNRLCPDSGDCEKPARWTIVN
ncbi:GDP-fucose protein O-fucosyltransferase 2 [Manduca sexta]|uniref:GDP-fucose protein O-fucosyltransferase 2 n=1 Tax=Manduca sexta TaxID=7130 RepID=A0A922CXZ2_MANSE|nr:GDP-fucose protein O-fucosyltransferase 2 [Manduca sexta]KAG6462126.1 hypothetical protein O3G_MSEX013072 [Manduca sexta]